MWRKVYFSMNIRVSIIRFRFIPISVKYCFICKLSNLTFNSNRIWLSTGETYWLHRKNIKCQKYFPGLKFYLWKVWTYIYVVLNSTHNIRKPFVGFFFVQLTPLQHRHKHLCRGNSFVDIWIAGKIVEVLTT